MFFNSNVFKYRKIDLVNTLFLMLAMMLAAACGSSANATTIQSNYSSILTDPGQKVIWGESTPAAMQFNTKVKLKKALLLLSIPLMIYAGGVLGESVSTFLLGPWIRSVPIELVGDPLIGAYIAMKLEAVGFSGMGLGAAGGLLAGLYVNAKVYLSKEN